MDTVSLVITAVAGIAILLFGRQLFWLFVGVLGFITGMELAPQLLTAAPEWLILVVSLLIGLIGALLAVFLQYIAAAVAGFFGGWYLVLSLMRLLDIPTTGLLPWVAMLIGGVLGAILVLLLFDYALIILSSIVGANMLVDLFSLDPTLRLVLLLVLIVVGLVVQMALLSRSEEAPRRRPRRRTAR